MKMSRAPISIQLLTRNEQQFFNDESLWFCLLFRYYLFVFAIVIWERFCSCTDNESQPHKQNTKMKWEKKSTRNNDHCFLWHFSPYNYKVSIRNVFNWIECDTFHSLNRRFFVGNPEIWRFNVAAWHQIRKLASNFWRASCAICLGIWTSAEKPGEKRWC